jgi:acylglycerol lipase
MSETGVLSALDGTELLTRSWAAADARAQVLIVHGLGEHSGRWEHVGGFLAQHALAAYAFDLRGHGGSGGGRCDIGDFSEFLDDLEIVLQGLPEGLPTVVYGHSMGGLIAVSYAISDRPQPDLYVLSAPGLEADFPAWLRITAKVLGKVLPGMKLPNSIKGEQLSRDPAVGERYFADPLVITKTTARFGAKGLGQQEAVAGELGNIAVPTLVVHGAEDPLVPPRASAVLAGLPGVERKLFPGLRHEIHNEPEQDDVLGFIVKWIEDQLS